VLFEEATDQRDTTQVPVKRVSASEPARHLEEEVGRLKSRLRTTVEQYETQAEELKASNEELQAINEELRSATEELETSKEELQSLNEELRTVNQELKVKIDEQTQASNDIQNLINSTDFGTVFIDRGGRIKLFTPRARDIFALIPSDKGRPLTDISNELIDVDLPGDVDRVLDRLERLEREVQTRSGRWYLMRLVPYRTGDDKIDGVVLTFVDITERRRATERVLESEARLQRAIEVESVGVLFFTLEGVITDANDAFLRLGGYTREMLRAGALRWHTLATADRHGQFAAALESLTTSGHAAPYEVECVRPDGTVWSAIFASRRLSSTDAVAFVIDITDRQRVNYALLEADRRRNEFLAALAHELRNPLAPIAAALDVMKLSNDGPRMGQARQVMERQVQHIIRLVEDLLELSRITLGKMDVRRDPIDLGTTLRASVETCAPAIDAARHGLIVSITPAPLVVRGDAVRLTQVFTNLLSNAAKYTPHGGTIRLTAEKVDGKAAITVADNGVGIAPQTLPYVFDLFTQGIQPAGGAHSGLGVGLALVRTLVEAHGGTVEATSAGLHHGSTFVVRLPIITPPPEIAAEPPPAATDISAHRIVVVDDNQDAANSLEALLSTLGADVRVAYDGLDGIAAIKQHRPSVVFIDLGMPGTDGFAVAKTITDDPDLSPVLVALTGWGQPDIQRRTRDSGFEYHLTKPASLEQLRGVLARVPTPEDRPARE
jgi:two-component system CheB/CheR fusion protein